MSLYKTIITLTVLSDRPIIEMETSDILKECDDGDFSCETEIGEQKVVTRQEMAAELAAQGSDPEFLLGEDGWKYQLHSDDEITVHDGERPLAVTIQSVEIIENENSELDRFSITDKNGIKHHCWLADIS